MAEFIENNKRPDPDKAVNDAFARMGHPIDFDARNRAMKHMKDMGVTDTQTAMEAINRVAEQLERDQPYEAMKIGMQYLDLTGTYRLFAALLT